MAYTINYSDTNKGTISIEDSTINQQTSLDIPGRNTTSYGSVIAENFLKQLENFANTSAPRNPIQGQLWYDSSTGVDTLKLYDGTGWVSASGLKKGNNAPGWEEFRLNKKRKAAGISGKRYKSIKKDLRDFQYDEIIENHLYRTPEGQRIWLKLGFPYVVDKSPGKNS